MRRNWLLIGLIATTSMAAACGSPGASEGEAGSQPSAAAGIVLSQHLPTVRPSPGSGSGAGPTSPVAHKDTVPGLDERIETVDMPEGYPEEITVHSRGNILTIRGREGGCSTMHAELARQSRDRVDVTVVETVPADETTMCTMDIRHPLLTVELAEPLGERSIGLHYEKRWRGR